MKLSPVYIFWIYTRLCNSRCTTCLQWQSGALTLDLATTQRVARHISPDRLKEIYFTGGEPLLPDNAVDVAVALHLWAPDAVFSGATNGLCPSLYVSRIEAMRAAGIDTRIQVSLNGSPATHDATRGIPGAYVAAMETARRLARIGCLHSINQLLIPNVTTDDDIAHVQAVAQWLGTRRATSPMRRIMPLFGQADDGATVSRIPHCSGGTEVVCVHPDGEITACQEPRPDLHFGNLRDDCLDPEQAERIIGIVRRAECQPCGCCTTAISEGKRCTT